MRPINRSTKLSLVNALLFVSTASSYFLPNRVPQEVQSPLLRRDPDLKIQPIVDLGYSTYRGISLPSGVNQFLGVRYAAPPLGDLRFRAPAEPVETEGVQDGTAYRAWCLGINDEVSISESEDCLFMNIWAPSSATPLSHLPVWFFIQGGGYVSNASPNFNGSTVVAKSGGNIVYVEINWRVGPYGFLTSEKVRQNGDLNAGLLDQRAALKWVKKYIAAFGGNPDHVVIHGDSAGAGSVALHMTAYGGRNDNLFVGGILESTFFPTQPKVSELEWQFDRFVNDTGCGNSTDQLECLRSLSTEALQAVNIGKPYPGRSSSPLFPWTPTVDGDFIQDYPYFLFEQGKVVQVPVMIGDDTNEGSFFAPNATSTSQVSSFFQDNYPLLTATNTTAINTQYPLEPPLPDHNAYFPSASSAYGEATFTCPGLMISRVLAKLRSSLVVWNYRYAVLDDANVAQGLGTPHVSEQPAILGLGNANDALSSSYSTYNAPIIPIVMDYWISFVRELSPNRYKSAAAPHWESFGDGRRLVLRTNATGMEVVDGAQWERCAFWEGLAGVMEQ